MKPDPDSPIHEVSVVLAGPAGAGKLATLHALSERLDPRGHGRTLEFRADEGRVVVADLSFLSVGGGITLRPRVTTITGEVPYRQTWQQIFRLADVVVFTASSHPERAEANIAEYHGFSADLHTIDRLDALPRFLQINETDVRAQRPAEEVVQTLDPAVPFHVTAASRGEGVVELFATALDLALSSTRGGFEESRGEIERHLLDIAAGRLP